MHLMALAFSFARASAGNSRLARIAMMAITTSNSIRVNPRGRFGWNSRSGSPMVCDFIECFLNYASLQVTENAAPVRLHQHFQESDLIGNCRGASRPEQLLVRRPKAHLHRFYPSSAKHATSNSAVAARRLHSGPISDRKSTRLNSSHLGISYAVFC